ncbi:MAG TPA: protein translocase subunit SecD [Gammaproteobacteria bacterium]|nr:protein translocase subunit SecD [Gammaproteobacteria bacterium]
MNQNPVWKYLALVFIVTFGLIYAIPNVYQAEPGVQVIGSRNTVVDQDVVARVSRALENSGVLVKAISFDGEAIRATVDSEEAQNTARDVLKSALGDNYAVALADVATTPSWLSSLGGKPMFLGLDLRGGVHFLMQVDMSAAKAKAMENYEADIRRILREERIRYSGLQTTEVGDVEMRFRTEEDVVNAGNKLRLEFPELGQFQRPIDTSFELQLRMSEQAFSELSRAALKKNMLSIRNRIDQLGVSEPIIQQQGLDRIVVQLPGVKDPTEAKSILGKTATLEVRLVDEKNALASSVRGNVPIGSKRFNFRDGTPILLENRILFAGENIVDAAATFDSQGGGQVVSITLDAKAAAVNSDVTGDNIGNRMAVVYVETRINREQLANGDEKVTTSEVKEVITAPVIRDQLGKRFQITGLDRPGEAQELSLLLRAGSLAAPLYIVEERTIGPSLGAENIEKGFKSVAYGFLAVLIFMIIYYRLFGFVASFALVLNLVIIVAVLSLLQATLTLPGVAGMVLTVGMAVDANVLIFERIREELQAGASPQLAIHRGYDNAFSTIIDANITTLLAALVLFNFGTGPIQGFAITLSIGIMTSMVTAIFVTRILVNLIYGNRRLDGLNI